MKPDTLWQEATGDLRLHALDLAADPGPLKPAARAPLKEVSHGMKDRTKRLLIKAPYWMGIAADAAWAVALVSPRVFGFMTGRPDFAPDPEVRLIRGIGPSLMAGWTLLLVWAVRAPVERRMVILLTAFPVVFGLFVVALIGFLGGNAGNAWVIAKTLILFVSMIASYLLAGRYGD